MDRRELLGAGLAAGAVLVASPPGASSEVVSDEVTGIGLTEAAARLRRGALSPVELTRACLARIEAQNPALNAFITVTAEQALAEARAAEREIRRDRPRSPLHGIPIALKDNIDTAGVRTTAASAVFAERVPNADAAVVERLRAAGAIVLGKLNMDECAYGVSSTSGHLGAVHNPWSVNHISGGSSGGPAAAVAARMCYAALGTDTGGSVRQPAAYCGLTGLKPTYGLVSCRGVMPLSWSLDHVGPLARSAEDAATVLQAVAGYDPGDAASSATAPGKYAEALRARVGRLRLARPGGVYFENLDPEVAGAVAAAIEVLAEITGPIREVELPPVPALAILFVEASAYLSSARKQGPSDFSPAVRTLIDMGTRIPAVNYAEALRELTLVRRAAARVFEEVDLVVTPTTPDTPMTIDAARAPATNRGPPVSARNTTPFNIYGLPTVSVCCGFTRAGLPIGLQLAGAPFADGSVLALAHAYQQRTDWHRRAPPISAHGI